MKTLFRLLAVLTIVMLLAFTVSGAAVVRAQDEDGSDSTSPALPPVLVDADGDGVADGLDRCPDTPSDTAVGEDGCPAEGPSESLPEEPPEEPGEAELPPEEVSPLAPAEPPDAPLEAPVEVDAEPTPILEALPAEPEEVEALVESADVGEAKDYTYVSGFQVLNLDETDSTDVQVIFYYPNGSQAGTVTTTLEALGTQAWFVPNVTEVISPFVGSAVIQADRKLAATLNTQTPVKAGGGTHDDPNRIGMASAVIYPTRVAYMTQVMKEYYGWNSELSVQNSGSSPTTIIVDYYDRSGNLIAAARETATNVAPNAAHIFYQKQNANLPGGDLVGVYSARVDGGGQNVAVVCNFYNSGDTYTQAQLHSYNGIGSGASTIYIPRLLKDFYDYQGGFGIQNISSVSTTVRITYYGYMKPGTNDPVTPNPTQTKTIGPYQSWWVYMGPPYDHLEGEMKTAWGSGAAIVEIVSGGDQIIATVNEDNRVGGVYPTHVGRGSTYNASTIADATSQLAFPQVTAMYLGYSGGWQVQSLEDGNSCTVSYTSADGYTPATHLPQPLTLNQGESAYEFAPDATYISQDYNGAVIVKCTRNVIGIVNLSHRPDRDPRFPTNDGDTLTTTGGINYY